MSLIQQAPGHFIMEGSITFDNAATVVADGQKLLSTSLSTKHWCIDLAATEQADSSALSVFLSWIRLAQKQDIHLTFSNMPAQLEALVQVSDLQNLLQMA